MNEEKAGEIMNEIAAELHVEIYRFLNEENEVYREDAIYFVHTDHYVLISMPNLNWSFIWYLKWFDDEQIRAQCLESLSGKMFFDDAEKVREFIYQHLSR